MAPLYPAGTGACAGSTLARGCHFEISVERCARVPGLGRALSALGAGCADPRLLIGWGAQALLYVGALHVPAAWWLAVSQGGGAA